MKIKVTTKKYLTLHGDIDSNNERKTIEAEYAGEWHGIARLKTTYGDVFVDGLDCSAETGEETVSVLKASPDVYHLLFNLEKV